MADLTAFRQFFLEDARQRVAFALADVVAITQAETPVDTGALVNSEGFEQPQVQGDVIVGAVFATEPYASFVDQGTQGPYVIVPKNAKVLHFYAGGEEVFARSVVHPGVRARNYFSVPMPDRMRAALQDRFAA